MLIVIKDPCIDPFLIEVRSDGASIFELKFTKNKAGDPIELKDFSGHYSSIEGALKKSCQLKVVKDNAGKVQTLKEYITAYKEVSQKLISAINAMHS